MAGKFWALGLMGVALAFSSPAQPQAAYPAPTVPLAGTEMVQCLQSQAWKSCHASDVKDFVLTSVKAYGAKGDGTTDDTVALQAAIDTGLPLYCPGGTYKTTATLNVNHAVNDGQVIRGSGSWGTPDAFNTSTGGNSCVIKPSSAVTIAIKIDGTTFAGGGSLVSWVQGFGLENLVIDMANMTDDANHIAINQVQAWDGHYTKVRVRNDGTLKRAWKFNAGAYTTQLQNTQGNILEFTGVASNNGVTTINVINHDGGKVIATYAGDLRFIGGTFQGTGTKFLLRNVFDIWIESDVEGASGTYLDVDTSVSFLHSSAELTGFGGTYMSGTPGQASMLWDQQASFNTYPANLTTGYLSLNNAGTAGGSSRSSFLSGAAGQQYYLMVGRTGADSIWGVAGGANDLLTGTASGDTVVGSNGAAQSTWIMAAGVVAAKGTSTGFNTFGTGTLNEATVNATTSVNAATFISQPAADGQMFTLENHTGSAYVVASSNATIGSSSFSVGNGASILGFSDNAFSTQTFRFNSATGAGTLRSLAVTPTADGAILQANNSGSTPVFSVTTNATAANSTTAVTGGLTVSGEITGSASTTARASLNLAHGSAPTSPVNGDIWTTTTGLFARINGGTVGPFGAGGGSGTVTETGTHTSGSLAIFSTAPDIITGNLSGDCTTAGTVATTCLKTNGVSFTSAATTAIGTSGATIPLLSTANTWTLGQTFSAAMTYGGVTLANSVQGTGSMVLATTPTLTTPVLGAATGTSLVLTGTSANIVAAGPAGSTNPSFVVDASTASAATGLKVKSAAAAGGLAISVSSSGANENLTVNALGTGTIGIGTVSTGAITLTRATTLSGALTYGGVTLSNAVTGTGNMVLSTSPALTTPTLGVAGGQTLTLTPAADGQMFTLAGTTGTYWLCQSNLTVANSLCGVGNSAKFKGYSDSGFSTNTFTLDSSTGSLLSASTGGVGYATGSGGTVTQITSRATGVTLSKTTGAITLLSAAGSATWSTFTVTNTLVAATDTIVLNQKSGANLYNCIVTAVAAGSFNISVSAVSGTATEAPVINFTVIKGVTS